MERINSIYIISYGNSFRFTDNLPERITYVNRGSTVVGCLGSSDQVAEMLDDLIVGPKICCSDSHHLWCPSHDLKAAALGHLVLLEGVVIPSPTCSLSTTSYWVFEAVLWGDIPPFATRRRRWMVRGGRGTPVFVFSTQASMRVVKLNIMNN